MATVEDRTTSETDRRQAEIEFKAREIAAALDRALNGDHGGYPEHGFALLLFRFEDPQASTYISNGLRDDMIYAIEEWLQRVKSKS